MSSGVRQSQLETLLARVKKNATLPRAARAFASTAVASSGAAASNAAAELELDEPGALEAPPPVVAQPPVAVVPPVAAAPAEPAFVRPQVAEPALASEPALAAMAEPAPLDELEVEDIDAEEIDLDGVDLDDDAPESHSSPRHSIDEAIASAEHAAPLTPPPESGAEPLAAPHIPAHSGPTMEQLGETISLDEGPSRDFELDEPLEPPVSAPISSGLLEAELPRSVPASFTPDLQAPPEAAAELERVRIGATATIEPDVVVRPSISTNVVDFVGAQRSFAPSSFAELVDASLSL